HRDCRVRVQRRGSERMECSSHAECQLGPRLDDVQIVLYSQVRQVGHPILGANQIELHAALGEDAEGFTDDRVDPIENHTYSHGGSLQKTSPAWFGVVT